MLLFSFIFLSFCGFFPFAAFYCQFNVGLIMLIGIIMYISLFKSEIGSKLRPRSMFQSALFTYRYGHSFILFVIGCISAELVGTLNFFLFIQIREIGREKVSHIPNTKSTSAKYLSFHFWTINWWNVNSVHFPICGIIASIIFWCFRQFHALCMQPHQKTRQMKSEWIRLERNLKHSRLLNVKSIRRYRTHFFHRIRSDGKCSLFSAENAHWIKHAFTDFA